jgi:hypothetical protein
MASSSLVALAASLKEALASPQSLVATTKEEEDARLDIIDMLPDLKRALVGEFQNLWDLSWGVSIYFILYSALQKRNLIGTIVHVHPIPQLHLQLQNPLPRPPLILHLLHLPIRKIRPAHRPPETASPARNHQPHLL